MPDAVPSEVLLAFGMQDAEVTPIEQGLVNRHWRLDLGDRRYVLRRYHPRRTGEAIAWEQWLVDFAAKLGWPVAKPVASGDGSTLVEHGGWYCAVAPFLEGTPFAGTSVTAYRRQGEALAELHDNLSDLEGPQRPGFGPTWDLDMWVGLWGATGFDAIVDELDRVRPELASLIRTERAKNVRELIDGGVDDLPLLPIHGDFQRFNLLWEGERITGIVDFDFCRRDVLIADLAPLLSPFMPLEIEEAAALFDGYQSVRPLSQVERTLLLPMARAGLLRWVATLVAEWGGVGAVPDGIERTMTVRWPAFEQAAPAFEALLSASNRT